VADRLPAIPTTELDGRPLAIPDALASLLAGRWPYVLIVAVGLLSRLRYAVWGYHDSFGSGDAHGVLTRALLIERGDFEPSATIGPVSAIFSNPPLIPLLLAGVAKTGIPLADVPLLTGTLITLAALCALYAIATRAFDRTVALAGVLLVAVLPRFSFDSTEPDKVAYVVSLSIIALFLLYEGQRRPPLLLLAGLSMGLAAFSHTTAYLFVPVYVLSHVALSRGDLRRILGGYFLASLAIVALFVAAYGILDDRFAPQIAGSFGPVPAPVEPASIDVPVPADAPAQPADDAPRFVPSVVERYWDTVSDLAGDGFRDSAWDVYFDGIRGQVLDPVYVLAIAGFIIALWLAFARRSPAAVPLLLWMSVVTIGFAVQYPAPSHGTRYPSYVTPAFVLMASFFVAWAARQLTRRAGKRPEYAIALAAPFFAWAAFSYVSAPEPGLREIYAGHREAATFVAGEDLLSDDARLLYLAWPSYTYFLLEEDADNASYVRTFGWRMIPVNRIDAAYVERERIRYYLYDELTDDYRGSAARVKTQLEAAFDLREVRSFCTAPLDGGCVGRVILYELGPRS
jgi:hypothetical protein